MSRVIVCFSVAFSFCVVACFFAALVHALPVSSSFIVMVADPAVPIGERWMVHVIGITARGVGVVDGTLNGVPANPNLMFYPQRAERVVFEGSIDGADASFELRVPVVDVDAGVTLAAPQQSKPEGLLPLHDGLPRARITEITRERVLVEHEHDTWQQLLVNGRLVDMGATGMLDTRGAPDGALVVVSVAGSALPSSPARTLVGYVGRPVDDPELARLVPNKPRVGNIAPTAEEQRKQKQEKATQEAQTWRDRLRVVDAIGMLLLLLLAAIKIRQAPIAHGGAVVLVGILLFMLDAVLSFVM